MRENAKKVCTGQLLLGAHTISEVYSVRGILNLICQIPGGLCPPDPPLATPLHLCIYLLTIVHARYLILLWIHAPFREQKANLEY